MSTKVEARVAEMLPQLKDLSVEQLEGAVSVSVVEYAERRPTAPALMALGWPKRRRKPRAAPKPTKLLDSVNKRARQVLCDPEIKGDIKEALTVTNVTSAVVALLPVFHLSALAAPPIWVIALAVMILKIGIDGYCKGYWKASARR